MKDGSVLKLWLYIRNDNCDNTLLLYSVWPPACKLLMGFLWRIKVV